jgi:hypothetical protein
MDIRPGDLFPPGSGGEKGVGTLGGKAAGKRDGKTSASVPGPTRLLDEQIRRRPAERFTVVEQADYASPFTAIRHTAISSRQYRLVGVIQLWPSWAMRISASSGPQVPAW